MVAFFHYNHIIPLFLSYFLLYGPHILIFIYSPYCLICILFWHRDGAYDNVTTQDRLSIKRVKIMSQCSEKNKIKK